MHMADALLSPAVGLTMCAGSVGAIAFAVKNINHDELCEKKIPIMGVMGAFVFAAQMINFTIPATGSSGHIGGGVLLAAMLGSSPALLALSVVLLIQCLFFADGGLLALGCNIFNMAVIPCLLIYPLVFRPLVKQGLNTRRLTIASITAAVLGLQLGALAVVLQTWLSGISGIPFATFALLMQPIHLAIGLAEGLITAAVLCFVHSIRPEIMHSTMNQAAIKSSVPLRRLVLTLGIIALFTGGALSLFASSHPDGLEWSLEKATGMVELDAKGALPAAAASLQDATALMPDYNFKNTDNEAAGTATAGIAGGILTFVLAIAAAAIISVVKKRRKKHTATA